MITTVDPQMKQYIRMYSSIDNVVFDEILFFVEPGHEVHIVVTSAKDVKLTPVRDAFTHVFGRATTQGIVGSSNELPLQIILSFATLSLLFRVFNPT